MAKHESGRIHSSTWTSEKVTRPSRSFRSARTAPIAPARPISSRSSGTGNRRSRPGFGPAEGRPLRGHHRRATEDREMRESDGVFAIVNGCPPDEDVMVETGAAIAWPKSAD